MRIRDTGLGMNLWFSPSMLPVIYTMAVNHRIATEQIVEMRRIAKSQGISEKYIKAKEG